MPSTADLGRSRAITPISGAEASIGAHIRELRQQRGITLAELSNRAKISIGSLSQLERGLASPTVRTLFTIGEALGISPALLIDPNIAVDQGSRYVVRADRGKVLINTEGLRKLLVSSSEVDKVKAYHMVIEPNGSSGPDFYHHGGEETGYVVSGGFELHIGEEAITLREGDCFSFASHLPHRFTNPGAVDAVVFWVNANV